MAGIGNTLFGKKLVLKAFGNCQEIVSVRAPNEANPKGYCLFYSIWLVRKGYPQGQGSREG